MNVKSKMNHMGGIKNEIKLVYYKKQVLKGAM